MDNKTLKNLINGIIKEELTIATSDGTSVTATSDQKVAAKKELDKGGAVKFTKRGTNLTEDEELDEMARIATYVKKGDDAAFSAAMQKYAGTWVEDMLTAVAASEKGLTQPEMVVAAGKQRQQDINPYVRKLQADGTLILGDPSKEKQVKDTVPGALGRRPTEDGKKAQLAKAIMAKLIEDPGYVIKPEAIEFLGQEQIDKIKAVAASGGPKRGRKMGGSTKQAEAGSELTEDESNLDEMARIPTLYQIGDISKLDSLGDKAKNSKWVKGIIQYIEDNGPAKIIDIATKHFNVRQQGINPVVQSLVSAGVLSPVAGSNEPTPQYKKDGSLKQTTQQRAKAKPDAEDYFVGNHNGLSGNDDDENEIVPDFTGGTDAPVADDEFAEKEPEIDTKSLEKTSSSSSSLSDEEYESFMAYLKYSEQLAKLKAAQTKNKKIGKSGDDLKGGANDEQGRIAALKDKLEAKVADLVAGSPFLQKRIAKETGVEYVPPVVDDIEKVAGDDDEDLDEISLNLNEGLVSRFKVLAGI